MIYVVDTNVISEITKKKPCGKVIDFLETHEDSLYLTAISIEEMRFGELMLDEGKRRDKLHEMIDALVDVYSSRTFAFDAEAAGLCAAFHRQAIGCGRTPSIEDLMIASICVQHDAVLLTRNVKDFDYLDVPVQNPFA